MSGFFLLARARRVLFLVGLAFAALPVGSALTITTGRFSSDESATVAAATPPSLQGEELDGKVGPVRGSVSGTAAGPYPGTFTQSISPSGPDPFTIKSTSGTVTGTIGGPHDRYTATINGAFGDTGSSTVACIGSLSDGACNEHFLSSDGIAPIISCTSPVRAAYHLREVNDTCRDARRLARRFAVAAKRTICPNSGCDVGAFHCTTPPLNHHILSVTCESSNGRKVSWRSHEAVFPYQNCANCWHGYVALHANGGCPDKIHGGNIYFTDNNVPLICYVTYETDLNTTPPFCCGYGGEIDINSSAGFTCGSKSCKLRLEFFEGGPGHEPVFTCWVSGAASGECYTGPNQPVNKIRQPGGPLSIYVGESKVFDIRGYVP